MEPSMVAPLVIIMVVHINSSLCLVRLSLGNLCRSPSLPVSLLLPGKKLVSPPVTFELLVSANSSAYTSTSICGVFDFLIAIFQGEVFGGGLCCSVFMKHLYITLI
jgi:hypothetical protein